MSPGSTVLFKLDESPFSRARVEGTVIEDQGDTLVISYRGKTYERAEAACIAGDMAPGEAP